jgi:hypothetical protein
MLFSYRVNLLRQLGYNLICVFTNSTHLFYFLLTSSCYFLVCYLAAWSGIPPPMCISECVFWRRGRTIKTMREVGLPILKRFFHTKPLEFKKSHQRDLNCSLWSHLSQTYYCPVLQDTSAWVANLEGEEWRDKRHEGDSKTGVLIKLQNFIVHTGVFMCWGSEGYDEVQAGWLVLL